jgi:hypothetical protein
VLTPVRSIDTVPPDADDFMSRRLRSAVFDSCQPHASDTNLFTYNDQTLRGSTTTSPLMIRRTASVRLHHQRDLAIMRLRRRNDFATVSTSFGALTHDMQDYDFKARFESLPDSTTRLDTRGLLTRERLLGSSPLSYLLRPKNKTTTQSPRSSRLIRVRNHV